MKKIIILNDDVTPAEYVPLLLQEVFEKSTNEAESITQTTDETGEVTVGRFENTRAEQLLYQARAHISQHGHSLQLETRPADSSTSSANDTLNEQSDKRCAFCNKTSAQVNTLVAGPTANICDACIQLSAETVRNQGSATHFRTTHELLQWHFGDAHNEHIVTASRKFPARVRADLQVAVNDIFENKSARRFVGVHGGNSRFEELNIARLMEKGRNQTLVGPLQYTDVDIGDETPIKCLKNGLWLFDESGLRSAVLLFMNMDVRGNTSIIIEFASPAGEQYSELSQQFFRHLEVAVNQAKSYRGKVLSLEQQDWYTGMSSGITVHKLRDVSEDQIILPRKTLALLERNIISFAKKREQLKELKFSGKKGVLFHGPPGTGKTYTVHFLANHLPDHTTLLVTAEQVGIIKEYFLLARLLQPAILVIEDIDLIARDRESMGSPDEEALLNTLLNEMDGLKEDAEIFFILTTNRPDKLETALAARPGRIDQAIEFPLPDHAGRLKLIQLYAGDLELSSTIMDDIATRTDGVSAAFIKELMRRASQYYLEDDTSTQMTLNNIQDALDEMLFQGGQLNVKLLGGNASPDA